MRFLTQRATIAVFLSSIFAMTTVLGFIAIYVQPNGYRLLDWLINYEGGFVRRGLIGQIAAELYSIAGIAPTHTVFAFQIGAYAIFLLFSYKLLARIEDRAPFVLLIYSPFLFAFQIADITSGFRKEILLFPLLAPLAYIFANEQDDRRRYLALCAALALYPLLILSHEMLAFYFPYVLFFAGLVRLDRKRLALLAILAALSVTAAGLSALFKGDAENVVKICASLNRMLPNASVLEGCTVKNNAIRWLIEDVTTGFEGMKGFLPQMLGSIGPATLLIGLAFWPLAKLRNRWIERELRLLLLAAAVAGVTSLVLFLFAADWGRFIYVHVVAVSLILMALTVRAGPERNGQEVAVSREPAIPVWAVVVYFLSWNLYLNDELVGGGLAMKLVRRLLLNPWHL